MPVFLVPCRILLPAILLLFALTITPAPAMEPAIVVPAADHQQGNAQSVAFSADGRLVAAGFGGSYSTRGKERFQSGRIVIWEAATGKVVKSVAEHGDIVGLQFAADGKSCLYSRIYTPGDSVDANYSKLIPVGDGDDDATSLSFGRNSYIATLSPSGAAMAIAKTVDIAQVYDDAAMVHAAADVHKLSIVDSYTAKALAFSPDGETFAAVHGRQEPIIRKDGTVVLKARVIRTKGLTLFDTGNWSVQDSAISDELADCSALAVSPTARWLATGHPNGVVRIWDGRSLQKAHELKLETNKSLLPRFSPDGKTLAVLSQPPNALVWRRANTPSGFEFERRPNQSPCELVQYETETFTPLRTFQFEDGSFRTYHANLPAASQNPARLAFSPDSRQILVGCNGVILLDAETGETVRQFDAPLAAAQKSK
ncbi:WD40 repeat domain-containing protein [Blastopirellula marina]|nr:PD40 domain-containing protein [Blastopirellula marina]